MSGHLVIVLAVCSDVLAAVDDLFKSPAGRRHEEEDVTKKVLSSKDSWREVESNVLEWFHFMLSYAS